MDAVTTAADFRALQDATRRDDQIIKELNTHLDAHHRDIQALRKTLRTTLESLDHYRDLFAASD